MFHASAENKWGGGNNDQHFFQHFFSCRFFEHVGFQAPSKLDCPQTGTGCDDRAGRSSTMKI